MSSEYVYWLIAFGVFILVAAVILKIKFGVQSSGVPTTHTTGPSGRGLFGRLGKWIADMKKTAEEAKQDVESQFSSYISSQQLRFGAVQNRLMLEGTIDGVDTKITFYPVGLVGSKKKPYQGVAIWNVQVKLPSMSDDKKGQIVKALKEITAPYKGTVYKMADMVTISFPLNEITARPITLFEKMKTAFALK